MDRDVRSGKELSLGEFNVQHKLLRHLDRLNDWFNGDIPSPIAAELDPTNRCANKCKFCMYGDVQKGGESLGYDFMRDILRQLRDIGVLAVNVSGGGEPLENRATPEIIRYARDIGLEVGLITNGQQMTKDAADAAATSCEWVRVSLSATTRRTFLNLRGVDGFDAACLGILHLCDAKEKAESKVSIGVQWIYTGVDSWENLEVFIDRFLRALPVDYVQILPEQSYDEGKLFSQRGMVENYVKIHEHFHPSPRIVQSKINDLSLPNFGRDYRTCEGQHFYVMIGADGKVYVCCHLIGQKQFVIGDLYKEKLLDIWMSARRKEVAKSVDVRNCLHLCKHHESNKLLTELRRPVKDENFI